MFTLTVVTWFVCFMGLIGLSQVLTDLFYKWKDRGIKFTREGDAYPWYGEFNEWAEHDALLASMKEQHEESELFDIRNHDMNEYKKMITSEFECPMCGDAKGKTKEFRGHYYHSDCLEYDRRDTDIDIPLTKEEEAKWLKPTGEDWDDVDIPF